VSHLRSAGLLLGLALVPVLCTAQPPALEIPYLGDMRREAIESVSVTIGPFTLWLARHLIGSHDPDSAAVKKLLQGLHKVQVRSFQFKSDHVYEPAQLQGLRRQLTAPGWHQMVEVRDHAEGADVDIYYALDGRTVAGLAILAAEPREFTVVNISGTIDPEQIELLRHHFVPGSVVRSMR